MLTSCCWPVSWKVSSFLSKLKLIAADAVPRLLEQAHCSLIHSTIWITGNEDWIILQFFFVYHSVVIIIVSSFIECKWKLFALNNFKFKCHHHSIGNFQFWHEEFVTTTKNRIKLMWSQQTNKIRRLLRHTLNVNAMEDLNNFFEKGDFQNVRI